ncbi:hypothetical protein SPLC1_S050600 [Arthrospira platensis C1]|nr:hypothetical protein SPLC1_S050600 [Arthrospira platensis C1]
MPSFSWFVSNGYLIKILAHPLTYHPPIIPETGFLRQSLHPHPNLIKKPGFFSPLNFELSEWSGRVLWPPLLCYKFPWLGYDRHFTRCDRSICRLTPIGLSNPVSQPLNAFPVKVANGLPVAKFHHSSRV